MEKTPPAIGRPNSGFHFGEPILSNSFKKSTTQADSRAIGKIKNLTHRILNIDVGFINAYTYKVVTVKYGEKPNFISVKFNYININLR